MSFWKKIFAGEPTPPEKAKALRRNEPCWCGSEKKYKQCHFESDRTYFVGKQNEACSGPT